MASRWLFKQHEAQPMLWTWRLLGAGSCIRQQAGEFEDYGAAVTDAVRNGFHPDEDHWIVETAREAVHHEHGRKPLVILKKDPNSLSPARSAAGPFEKAPEKSGPILIGEKQEQ
jgi:hypothetical protein